MVTRPGTFRVVAIPVSGGNFENYIWQHISGYARMHNGGDFEVKMCGGGNVSNYSSKQLIVIFYYISVLNCYYNQGILITN